MIAGSRVVVVVPAYRESPRIARVLRGMPGSVDRVIIVDDASDDGTAEAARAVGDPRALVVVHEKNQGVGAAIVSGYKVALACTSAPRDAFVVMAGDGQMDPADLPALVLPIARGEAGYVKGDRFRAPEVRHVMPTERRIGGQILSWMTSRAIGQSISDSQCGYTALARGACEKLDLEGVWHGYGYPNDVLGQLAVRKIPIAETRVRPVYGDEESKLRLYHLSGVAGVVLRAWVRRKCAETIAPPH
jgi:glycosyltransferase involved in cell wall biosynthesis